MQKYRDYGTEIVTLSDEFQQEIVKYSKLYHQQFYDEDPQTGNGKSVVIYGESNMDRSPCGTGTTARMTLLHHRGKLGVGQVYRNTGPLGTVFEGRIVQTPSIDKFDGIICQVRGNAQITGYHQFVVDANDSFPEGFLI